VKAPTAVTRSRTATSRYMSPARSWRAISTSHADTTADRCGNRDRRFRIAQWRRTLAETPLRSAQALQSGFDFVRDPAGHFFERAHPIDLRDAVKLVILLDNRNRFGFMLE